MDPSVFGTSPPKQSGFDLAGRPFRPRRAQNTNQTRGNVMAAPFTQIVEPDRAGVTLKIGNYGVNVSHETQKQSVPGAFLDAMTVRTEVFVKEQNVPAENEFDEDDRRCVHIVAYSSVQRVVQRPVWDSDGTELVPKKSQTERVPIGTLRIVPFPAGPHPEPGAQYWGGRKIGLDGNPEPLPDHGQLGFEYTDRATTFHNGVEHYVKFGRLAVVKSHRGNGIAGLLVRAAQDWLLNHPTYFNPSAVTWGLKKLGSKHGELPKWRGLIGVHAQRPVAEAWKKWGFEIDQGMGLWLEEGIEHIGMFKRLPMHDDNDNTATASGAPHPISTFIKPWGVYPAQPAAASSSSTSAFTYGGKRFPVWPDSYAGYPFSVGEAIEAENALLDQIANEGRKPGEKTLARKPLPSEEEIHKFWLGMTNKDANEPPPIRSPTMTETAEAERLAALPPLCDPEPEAKDAAVMTESEVHAVKGLQRLTIVGGTRDFGGLVFTSGKNLKKGSDHGLSSWNLPPPTGSGNGSQAEYFGGPTPRKHKAD
jgi:predicted GNAT family N-acyltransferase